MNHRELKNELKKIGERAVETTGYELVDVSLHKKTEPLTLEFIVYHPEGVKIDDCVTISREIDQRLDQMDLIRGSYQLEVGSPGLDRPLKTKDDFRRNIGKLVEAHLYVKLRDKKDFQGILCNYDEEYIYLDLENEEKLKIPQKSISLLRQVIVF